MAIFNSFRITLLVIIGLLATLYVRNSPDTKTANEVPNRTVRATSWPKQDVPPPFRPEWKSLLRSSNIPVRKALDATCSASDPYCTWSCTNCLAPDDIAVCAPKGSLALSFDDGPSGPTELLLDYLDKYKIKVTFFVVGSRLVEKSAQKSLLRAYNAGHVIAGHSWSHTAFTTQTNEQIIAELLWTHEIINSVIGTGPKYVRPPYGDTDKRVRDVFKRLNYKTVMWSTDTNDWAIGTSTTEAAVKADYEKMLIDLMGAESVDGIISLQHDVFSSTIDVVPSLLDLIVKYKPIVKLVHECNNEPNPYQAIVTATAAPIPANPTTNSTVPKPANPTTNSTDPKPANPSTNATDPIPVSPTTNTPVTISTGNAASQPTKTNKPKDEILYSMSAVTVPNRTYVAAVFILFTSIALFAHEIVI